MLKVPEPAARPRPAPFTPAELRSRRDRLWDAAAELGVDTVVAYGANRFGSAVPWLTTWPVTREAICVLEQGRPARLLVGFPNHVPEAQRTIAAAGVGDEVESLEERADTALLRLLSADGPRRRIGVIGPLASAARTAISDWATSVVELDHRYTALRLRKSVEELRWLEHAAWLTDQSAAALLSAAAHGASEEEMVAEAEYRYRQAGGSHHICYVMVTSMTNPDRCVPSQRPSTRRTAPGSVVSFELSAAWGPDYPGQLLRTATVGAAPTPLFKQLHQVAEQVRDEILGRLGPGVLPADLLAVLEPVKAAGFRMVDDVIHGFGGGYLPPVLRERVSSPAGLHARALEPGMTLVVQPNVCTSDLRAGVQTGELVAITEEGYRSLHDFPAGLLDAAALAPHEG